MLQSRNVYNVYTILSINYSFFCSVMLIYPMRYIWRRQLPREYHCNYKILQLYTRYHKIYYIILSHFWFVSSSKKTSGKPRHPWPLSGNLPSIDARVAALQAILSGCFTHGEPGGNWGVPGRWSQRATRLWWSQRAKAMMEPYQPWLAVCRSSK